MGYRESKSIMLTNIVKEQRVHGHKCVEFTHLRYALMGFERNYQIRIPSKYLNPRIITYTCLHTNLTPRRYSTLESHTFSVKKLNPWFLTGFSDAESNFLVRVVKSDHVKVGWAIQPLFQIGLHKKDLNLLKKIKASWEVGDIYYKENSCNFLIQSLIGLNVIVNHFEKFPLLTKKREDFLLFRQVVDLINQKKHLTLSGLHEIISLKASMNNGRLSTSLKEAFPHSQGVGVLPVIRPKRSDEELLSYNIDPHWMVGFTAGEGCFSVRVTNSPTTKTGFQVQLRFNITQHSIDKVFMNSLNKFWGCGKVFLRFRANKVDFQILKLKDLCDKVIPLFQNLSLQGEKSKDFADFCKVVEIVKIKGHLTNKGLNEIKKIKIGMNKGIKYEVLPIFF